MQRVTVSLPDDLAAALQREARRRRIPVSRVVREGVERQLGRDDKGMKYSFFGIGRSGHGSLSIEHEEILREEFVVDRDR